jgi:hypothetical protein
MVARHGSGCLRRRDAVTVMGAHRNNVQACTVRNLIPSNGQGMVSLAAETVLQDWRIHDCSDLISH